MSRLLEAWRSHQMGEAHERSLRRENRPSWIERGMDSVTFIFFLIGLFSSRIACSIFGHRWMVMGTFGEDGGEEMECHRCGDSHRRWFG